MKKGPEDGIDLFHEAMALVKLGNFREAVAKLRPALAASQKNGDEMNVIVFHLMMIRCHAGLEEVSWRSNWRGFFEKLTSLSHSTRSCCASVTSWSRY